jgi:hypothetical protein
MWLTGRRISRAGDGERARRSLRRLQPRDGPRERPQHAELYPPPRCADCLAPPGRWQAATGHRAWIVAPSLTESLEGARRQARQALASAHRNAFLLRARPPTDESAR